MSEVFTFDYVLDYAKRGLPAALFVRLCEDRVADQEPTWHEYGVLGHMHAVYSAATQLFQMTGMDIRAAAALHDIGKFQNLKRAFSLVDRTGSPGNAYYNHEAVSADFAQGAGLQLADCLTIRLHHFAYLSIKDQSLIIKLRGDQENFLRWMLLCAADAVGKGWTPAQREQRSQIAEKFERLSAIFHYDRNNTVLLTALAAVREWELPEVPVFTGRQTHSQPAEVRQPTPRFN